MLKRNLNALIEPEKTAESDKETDVGGTTKMTPGQMLLAGFSGLFAKVEAELCTFYDALKKLQPNEVFDSIELNQEQNNLKVIILDLYMLFFLRKWMLSFGYSIRYFQKLKRATA